MTSIILAALFAAYICCGNGQSTCTTPDGGVGTCKSIHQCDMLLNLVQKKDRTSEDTDMLRASHCGFQENTALVCCPEPCYTPEGLPGKCLNIHSCSHLEKMLSPPVSLENMQYLRNSRCQDSDQNNVCCGPPPDLNPVSTGNCAATVSAFPPDPRTECCGRNSRVDKEVVAVGAVSIYQYPWLAMIEYAMKNKTKPLCVGSLISGKYVLTAAHCVATQIHQFATPKNIRLGEYDAATEGPDCVTSATGDIECTEGAIVIPIEEIIPHPDYQLYRNDIALIRMQRMAPFTDFIRPICLPLVDLTLTPPANFTLFAGSWGAVNKNESQRQIKVHVDLPYVNIETCQRDFYSDKRVNLWNKQFCAGGEVGKDTCKGDAGSPLMHETEKTFGVIGITSFGSNPCGKGIPGVYTNVYEYNTWIRRTIKP